MKTKKKMTHRITLYFSFILFLFAIVVLTTFFILLNQQSAKIYQNQMIEHGQIIADNLTNDFEENDYNNENNNSSQHQSVANGRQMHGGMRSYYSTIQLIQQMTGGKIWLVTTDGSPLFEPPSSNHMGHGKGRMLQQSEYTQPLTDTSNDLLNKVTQENTIITQNNKMLAQVGLPIYKNKQLIGAVLMEAATKDRLQQQFSDFSILFISLLIALILTVFMAFRTAKKIVKPIQQMENFTTELIDENYHSQLQINTEDELNQLANQLNSLGSQLEIAKFERENKEIIQKRFLSQISHELRTPVMIIQNSIETLNDQFDDTSIEQKEYLELLMNEAEQLELLLNDLLELNRLQSTEFSLEEKPVDLYEVIENALRAYRNIANQKQQTLRFFNQLTEQTLIIGDYQRLAQLIRLLLDNSIKYSPTKEEITIILYKNNDYLSIDIQNKTTQQIDEKKIQQLFDTFERGQHSNIPGHGLGLSIAKQITARHDGIIHLNKTKPQLFIVSLDFPIYYSN